MMPLSVAEGVPKAVHNDRTGVWKSTDCPSSPSQLRRLVCILWCPFGCQLAPCSTSKFRDSLWRGTIPVRMQGDCLSEAQPQPPTLVSMAVQGVSHLAAQPTKFDDATTVQILKTPFKGPSNNTMRRGFLPVDVLNTPLNAPVVPVECGLSQFSNWLPATKTSLTVWKLAVFLRSFNRRSF